MSFLNSLKTIIGKGDRQATVIWSCDPLVVADEEGKVIYAEKTDVEFDPDEASPTRGLAKALIRNADGEGPTIRVNQRFDEISMVFPNPSRGGFTLMGEDLSGNGVTWYIDKAADIFLLKEP